MESSSFEDLEERLKKLKVQLGLQPDLESGGGEGTAVPEGPGQQEQSGPHTGPEQRTLPPKPAQQVWLLSLCIWSDLWGAGAFLSGPRASQCQLLGVSQGQKPRVPLNLEPPALTLLACSPS